MSLTLHHKNRILGVLTMENYRKHLSFWRDAKKDEKVAKKIGLVEKFLNTGFDLGLVSRFHRSCDSSHSRETTLACFPQKRSVGMVKMLNFSIGPARLQK